MVWVAMGHNINILPHETTYICQHGLEVILVLYLNIPAHCNLLSILKDGHVPTSSSAGLNKHSHPNLFYSSTALNPTTTYCPQHYARMCALLIYTITAVTIAVLVLPHPTGPSPMERLTTGVNALGATGEQQLSKDENYSQISKHHFHDRLHGKAWCDYSTLMNPKPPCFESKPLTDNNSEADEAQILCFDYNLPQRASEHKDEYHGVKFLWVWHGFHMVN